MKTHWVMGFWWFNFRTTCFGAYSGHFVNNPPGLSSTTPINVASISQGQGWYYRQVSGTKIHWEMAFLVIQLQNYLFWSLFRSIRQQPTGSVIANTYQRHQHQTRSRLILPPGFWHENSLRNGVFGNSTSQLLFGANFGHFVNNQPGLPSPTHINVPSISQQWNYSQVCGMKTDGEEIAVW
jgi:hypothetical protein